jgi:protein-arginine deiminase
LRRSLRACTVSCALLAACGTEATPQTQAVETAPPPTLTLTRTAIVAGAPSEIVVTGAPAGASVALLTADSSAPDAWCPAPIAPDCLDLVPPVTVQASVTADASGTATFQFTLPGGFPTTELSLQAGAITASGALYTPVETLTIHGRDSDLDGDGLGARDEVLTYGTDPETLDTDGGGDADGVEAALGTDPTVPGDDSGALADAAGVDAPAAVIGSGNFDDDNNNNREDWNDNRFAADDDLVSFEVRPSANGNAAGFTQLRFQLTGNTANIVLRRNGNVFLDNGTRTATLPWQGGPITLEAEYGDFLVEGTLSITEEISGFALAPTVVELVASPMVLNHHLQPAESVWMTSINDWSGSNQAMVNGYAAELGNAFTAVNGNAYGGDPWMQDEVEFATLTSPSGRIDVVIDSIRDRGLDDFAEDFFSGPDNSVQTFGRGSANSQDSFGNLEVSPPVTVDGVDYPFGRIYYGALGRNFGPVQALEDVLSDQLLQAPFTVDTSWLCVGHVDEFMSFVPDPAAPKGFWFVYADTREGYDLIDSLPSSRNIPQHAGFWSGHGYSTIGGIKNDNGLRNYNDDLQVMHLDPIYEQMKAELGLDDNDVIRIPSIFEPVSGCSNAGAAMVPGLVNLIVANVEGEPTKVFMADPFLGSNVNNQSGDALIQDVDARFPSSIETYYLDDWDIYHLGLGEVHCGTNVVRTPVDNWWQTAGDLLGRN